MTQNDVLLQVAQCLTAAGIPFMVAGSVVSSAYSQPRSTNDVDIVIDPEPAQLEHWLTQLGSDYYVNADAARDAVQRRSMFNIIHLKSGWKVDLIVRKDRPFSVGELQRKRTVDLGGQTLPVATAEDTILTKLEWNLITPSERQVLDALQVAIAQWSQLDVEYLRKWAPSLGVADDLEKLLRVAEQAQQPPGK
jgi:hypothetical protein